MGPPQPTPTTASSPRRTDETSPARTPHRSSAVPAIGVGSARWSVRTPPPSTRPTASLVPPMSTASATSNMFAATYSSPCRRLAPALRRPRPNLTWLTQRRREYEAVATSQTAAARGATFSDYYDSVVDNVERVIQGKRDVIELVLLCLVSEGHLLLEDVPGVGKTNLAKSLATSLECSFGRVQFTPDLLPSDVVGITVWNRGDGSFDFRPGPVFNNVVLADEINRASPKTQAALARGHGREPGHGRRGDVSPQPAVHGHRHPEPHRARGDVPAARVPARPVPHAGVGGLSVARRRARDPRDPRRPRRLPGHRVGDRQRRGDGAVRRRQGRARCSKPQGLPGRPRAGDTPQRRTWPSASRHAPLWRCSGSPRPAPRRRVAAT